MNVTWCEQPVLLAQLSLESIVNISPYYTIYMQTQLKQKIAKLKIILCIAKKEGF